MLVFYFSGYGCQEKEKGIYKICPHDFQDGVKESGIDLQYLSQFFSEVNCKHILLILDSDYSGGIFE